MRIDRIDIDNFCGFVHGEFRFSPGFNLLVGVNGSGKSSLLQALAVGLQPLLRHVAAPAACQPQARVALLESGGRVRHERCYPVRLSLAAELAGAACAWVLEMSGPGCAWQDSGEAPDLASWVREARTLPLIACYPAERHWRLPQVSADSAMRQQESRLHGYQDWRDAAADTRGLESWVIGKTLERLEAVAIGEPTAAADELERVNQVIRLAMPGARGLRFDVKYRQLMLDWTQAACAPFDTLSDGQRGMVALLADIARRMCLLNPQLGDAVLSDTPGVVLIDELDLHLHPAWQRRLPGVLKRAFPRVQFIAASHSPQMIGELPFDEIWLMRDNQALGHPEHALGLSSNQVLEQLMDSAPRNPRIDEALREIDQLIDADHIGDAQTRLDTLADEVGQIPEVVGAQSAIDTLRWLEDDPA